MDCRLQQKNVRRLVVFSCIMHQIQLILETNMNFLASNVYENIQNINEFSTIIKIIISTGSTISKLKTSMYDFHKKTTKPGRFCVELWKYSIN